MTKILHFKKSIVKSNVPEVWAKILTLPWLTDRVSDKLKAHQTYQLRIEIYFITQSNFYNLKFEWCKENNKNIREAAIKSSTSGRNIAVLTYRPNEVRKQLHPYWRIDGGQTKLVNGIQVLA